MKICFRPGPGATVNAELSGAARTHRTAVRLRSAGLLPLRLPGFECLFVLVVGRIEPENRLSAAHALNDEGLEQVLAGGVERDLLGDVRRDYHDTFAVTHQDIAREYGNSAAADRHVEIDGVVLDQVGRCGPALAVGRERESRDLGGVAQATVAHHPGRAADHHAGYQDAACRCHAGVTAAVHHEHAAGR